MGWRKEYKERGTARKDVMEGRKAWIGRCGKVSDRKERKSKAREEGNLEEEKGRNKGRNGAEWMGMVCRLARCANMFCPGGVLCHYSRLEDKCEAEEAGRGAESEGLRRLNSYTERRQEKERRKGGGEGERE